MPINAGIFLLVASLACARVASADTQVFLIDNNAAQYFRPSDSVATVSAELLSATTASLLNAAPSAPNSRETSSEVDRILTNNIFARPQALLSIKVAGVQPGAAAQFVPRDKPARALQLEAGAPALGRRDSLPASISYTPLDHTALPGCSDICTEELLKAAAADVGAAYTPGPGPLNGRLVLAPAGAPGGAPGAELDLQQLPERLFAAELAALHRAVQDAAAEKLRRDQQPGATSGGQQVFEATLGGLQALADAHGSGSPQHQAASAALSRLLPQLLHRLSAAYNDSVAGQVAVAEGAPVRSGSLKSLLAYLALSPGQRAWHEGQRGRSLLDSGATGMAVRSLTNVQWQTRAAAWLAAIIIVVALLGGSWVLVFMPFKKDSLLYSRAKME